VSEPHLYNAYQLRVKFSQECAEVISDRQDRYCGCGVTDISASSKEDAESIRTSVRQGLRKTPHKVTAFVKVNQFS
jgi:hypothetical protein